VPHQLNDPRRTAPQLLDQLKVLRKTIAKINTKTAEYGRDLDTILWGFLRKHGFYTLLKSLVRVFEAEPTLSMARSGATVTRLLCFRYHTKMH
jgi:hypothetical protein